MPLVFLFVAFEYRMNCTLSVLFNNRISHEHMCFNRIFCYDTPSFPWGIPILSKALYLPFRLASSAQAPRYSNARKGQSGLSWTQGHSRISRLPGLRQSVYPWRSGLGENAKSRSPARGQIGPGPDHTSSDLTGRVYLFKYFSGDVFVYRLKSCIRCDWSKYPPSNANEHKSLHEPENKALSVFWKRMISLYCFGDMP